MRLGVAWVGPAAELFEEAMRVVPAVAKHRQMANPLDVSATYQAYMRSARDLELDGETAWAVLASAYSVWTQNLFELYAYACDSDTDTAIDSAIEASVNWVGSG